MYGKQTQTDVVNIKDKVSDDEDEGDSSREVSSKDSQRSEFNSHKDDTIEPEKQVQWTHLVWVPAIQDSVSAPAHYILIL